MPSDLMMKAANVVHRGLIGLSRGRLGWQAGSMPVLALTTVGRRTGERRTVMLTSPHQEGDAIVVVASRGGDDVHPAWYLNLVEHPEVEVETRTDGVRTMRARVADGEERGRLWPVITGAHGNYAGYQRRTDREIPVVVLEPVD